MQRKRLHSGLFPLCRDRREFAIAKKLQNHSFFCFWNELIAETEQIRKTEGASLQRSLPPQWRRQMRRCRFLFNRRADCRRRNRLIPQIPNTADGFQVLRKLRAELGTHTSNMDVDGSRATKIVKPPNATKQSVARIRTSRMRYKECQQRVFQIGKIDRLTVYGNLIRCQVDGHAINRDKIVCRAFISRPQ